MPLASRYIFTKIILLSLTVSNDLRYCSRNRQANVVFKK